MKRDSYKICCYKNACKMLISRQILKIQNYTECCDKELSIYHFHFLVWRVWIHRIPWVHGVIAFHRSRLMNFTHQSMINCSHNYSRQTNIIEFSSFCVWSSFNSTRWQSRMLSNNNANISWIVNNLITQLIVSCFLVKCIIYRGISRITFKM